MKYALVNKETGKLYKYYNSLSEAPDWDTMDIIELTDKDMHWIENFYRDLESLPKYKRPVNYLERALRILRAERRNTVGYE